MMKRITLALAAAAAIAVALPAFAVELETPRMARPAASGGGVSQWVAFASTPQGRVFKSDIARTEEGARQLAREECENTTARTCATTISVPIQFDVHIVRCSGPSVFMGASAQGNAYGYAIDKANNAGRGGCVTIAQY